MKKVKLVSLLMFISLFSIFTYAQSTTEVLCGISVPSENIYVSTVADDTAGNAIDDFRSEGYKTTVCKFGRADVVVATKDSVSYALIIPSKD